MGLFGKEIFWGCAAIVFEVGAICRLYPCRRFIKNRTAFSVLYGLPDLVTTKEEKEFHGYGIRIVRDIVTKYKGSVNFQEKDGMFFVQVSIPNVISS